MALDRIFPWCRRIAGRSLDYRLRVASNVYRQLTRRCVCPDLYIWARSTAVVLVRDIAISWSVAHLR